MQFVKQIRLLKGSPIIQKALDFQTSFKKRGLLSPQRKIIPSLSCRPSVVADKNDDGVIVHPGVNERLGNIPHQIIQSGDHGAVDSPIVVRDVSVHINVVLRSF